jgi:hypothetical protein
MGCGTGIIFVTFNAALTSSSIRSETEQLAALEKAVTIDPDYGPASSMLARLFAKISCSIDFTVLIIIMN